MSLPILVTIEDVDDLIAYLKTKPTGTTPTDAKKVIRKQILDYRKIPAYLAWDIVKKEGVNLKLGDRGWDLARNSRPKHIIYQEILKSDAAYLAALEWAFHQGLEEVTTVDIAAYWHEHYATEVGGNEKAIRDQAACFFRLCEASNAGKLTVRSSWAIYAAGTQQRQP
jgi:hypothetical protein